MVYRHSQVRLIDIKMTVIGQHPYLAGEKFVAPFDNYLVTDKQVSEPNMVWDMGHLRPERYRAVLRMAG